MMQRSIPALIKHLFLLFIVSLAFSVAAVAQSPFLQALKTFCGQSFKGQVVFPDEANNPFKGQALRIHFRLYTIDTVLIPFTVGTDNSRTWMLTEDAKGLLLKHDHRHSDGTPDSISFYGGYALKENNPFQQHFPADAYTASLIPAAATNEWTMLLSDDKKTFSYILKRDGALRFRADFDLTQPF